LALTPGTRLGVYEITAPLGEGGMGQVCRARDTKRDRDVAIKILPEAFAHDADRLTRFTQEAKTLASLNHPHIAQIYAVGSVVADRVCPSTTAPPAAAGLRDFIARTGADELIVVSHIYDHAARLRSYDITAGVMRLREITPSPVHQITR